MLNVSKMREMFPIYKNHPDLVYLDTSATSLKPRCVLDKMEEYYSNYGVNIHRGVYKLSYLATDEYDIAREKVAKFINAKFNEIVFKRNVSEALNFIALTYGEKYLQKGDVVITSELEHHSSVLPWMKLCERKGATLRYVPLDKEGRITIDNFKKVLDENVKVVALTYVSNVMGYITPIKEIIYLTEKLGGNCKFDIEAYKGLLNGNTRLVSIAHVSNVLGSTNPIKEIIDLAHQMNAKVVVDAAQAVAHFKVDVKDLDCDFLAFSSHKMMGPTGVGVLYGKKEILKTLDPLEYGGDMNDEVFLDDVTVKEIPYCFETGTPAIAEVLGLGKAIDFIEEIGFENIQKHCNELNEYAKEKLNATEINLGVFDTNDSAFNCYKSVGFEVVCVEKDAYQYNDESWNCVEMVLKK